MLEVGDIIDGKYRVERRVGEGGMGVVYEGRNLRIGRRVAIKVMHPEIAHERELVVRFEREASAAAKIGSAHIADVLDLGEMPSGERYIVMEFLEGETLLDRLNDRSEMSAAEIAPIAIQLLEGLSKIHEAAILHRDLKPSNIFLVKSKDGEFVKILDLGVCKFLDVLEPSEEKKASVTNIGDMIGTLSYISPEQLEHGARNLDVRTDIYSVGVILYRCLTGSLPYKAKNHIDMLIALRDGHVTPLREAVPDVDKTFARIVERAMEWDRSARFASALELQAALVEWVDAQYHVASLLTEFLDKPKPRPLTISKPPPPPATSAETPSRTRKRSGPRRSTEIEQSSAGPKRVVELEAALKEVAPVSEPTLRKREPVVPHQAYRDTEPDIDIEVDFDPDLDEPPKPKPATNPRGRAGTVRMKDAPRLPNEDDEVTLPKRAPGKRANKRSPRR